LNKEWSGSLTYYESDHIQAGGTALPKQFPGASAKMPNGATECGCSQGGRCPPNDSVWGSDGVWLALNFSLPDPHNYRPYYTSTGTGSNATFTAGARGDLNCNTTLSDFSRIGSINSNGDVTGSYQPTIVNELE
jgi:hypothetical protein